MKVLVTGSSGFLGRWIKICSAGKFDVVPYDLPDSILDGLHFAGKAKDVDAVLHMAAVADLNESDANPDRNFDVNIRGTHIVSQVCKQFKKPLHFISTCCVYGNAQPASIATVPKPTELYAASKMAGEYIAEGATIYRIPTLYGPWMRSALFIYRAIDAIYKDQPVVVHDSGMQSRQYGYAEDVADYICGGIESGATGTFNLNPERAVSVMEIVSVASRILGKTDVRLSFAGSRAGEIFHQDIKGVEGTQFEKGMAKTIAWYLDGVNVSKHS